MRIKVNGKYYRLRKEAKDMYLELACGLIIFTGLFLVTLAVVFVANTICPV